MAQIVAIDVNCTAPEHVASLVEQVRGGTRKPVLVYPNSGEHYDAVNKLWHGCGSAQHFAELSAEWHGRGARWIGGCCRTGPADIAAVRRWATSLRD